jgi:hypothetical protein
MFWAWHDGGYSPFRQQMQHLLGLFSVNEAAKIRKVAEDFVDNLNHSRRHHWLYVFCQLLNFMNLLLQTGLISLVYRINFFAYGPYAIEHWEDDALSTTEFPIFAYCKLPTLIVLDDTPIANAHCTISVNGVNSVVYMVVW